MIYTDVWVSMGEPDEVWAERIEKLPALSGQRGADGQRRGTVPRSCTACPRSTTSRPTTGQADPREASASTAMEVTDEVFEGPQSIVFDEAENRMHTIKAVMAATLGA